jgi:hypothetical protein
VVQRIENLLFFSSHAIMRPNEQQAS